MRTLTTFFSLLVGLALVTAATGQEQPAQPDKPADQASAPGPAPGGGKRDKPDFPPFEEVSKGYTQVISTADGSKSLYTVWVNAKKQEAIAELPANFEKQKFFVATSVAGGSQLTGWQWNDMYCYWTRLDDKLVLMQPNLQRQAKGGKQDEELRSAVERTFSDRVVTSAKILCMGPNKGPVIDLDDLLIKNSQVFTGMRGNHELASLGTVKAFPQNLEIPVTLPMPSGELTTLHYSLSVIPKTNYVPRESDYRIGYFLTVFKDLTKNEADGSQFVRYINRWNLQKRDPSLKLSPPREPIVFYIEHTVPVRYRRYVAEGILEWNKAFEKCGILNAIEVRQQDAQTGVYMDIQPEDVRYNYFRWITSETPFAMGPSRVNPETGEILDADIIFDDSMLKMYATQYKRMIEINGTDGVDAEALEFMKKRPLWNPLARIDRADPRADSILNDANLSDEQKADLLGLPRQIPANALHSRVVQQNLGCDFAEGAAMQMRTFNLAMRLMGDQMLLTKDGDAVPMIDGVPEEYLGGLLRYITCHEVGHTLGLRHNFKASTWLTLDDYVARDGEANTGSVMDYNATYIPADPAAKRGDWVTPTIGPYDYWAIEYGYSFDDKARNELLKQVAQRQLQFSTDEDASWGPDPYVNRWDLGAEPLDYARQQMDLVTTLRGKLADKLVKDGESWHLLRQAYQQLLSMQLGALRISGRYIGGVEVFRDFRGDPDARDPIVPVASDKQRDALTFVIANSFNDAAFDLRPEVLRKLATNKHRHWGLQGTTDEAFSVHDNIMMVQSFALLYIMNPGTLKRVYDNELRAAADEDVLTLPEVMQSVADAAYGELDTKLDGATFTNREPMISSLRRNLQSGLTDRLIDLALNPGPMPEPIQTLALLHLRQTNERLEKLLEKTKKGQLDDYSLAHLQDLQDRITKALNAVHIAN